MKIKLYSVSFSFNKDKYVIDLDLPDNAILTIRSKGSRIAGLSRYHVVEFIHNRKVIKTVENVEVEFFFTLAQTFLNQIIHQGLYAKNMGKIKHDSSYLYEYKLRINKTNKHEDMIKRLMSLERSGDTKLGFNCVRYLDDSKLEIEFNGHSVGGSYVYDWQVAPAYIESLQKLTGKVVTWDSRRNGGFFSDVYRFTIKLNSKVKNGTVDSLKVEV